MRVQIIINVDFDNDSVAECGADPVPEIQERVEWAIGNGLLTGDSALIVDEWDIYVRAPA